MISASTARNGRSYIFSDLPEELRDDCRGLGYDYDRLRAGMHRPGSNSIGGSGGSLELPGPLHEPPGPEYI